MESHEDILNILQRERTGFCDGQTGSRQTDANEIEERECKVQWWYDMLHLFLFFS